MAKLKKCKNAPEILSDGENNSNKDSDISILNDDCMQHIFSFLLIKDRIKIQRVCKKWQNIIKLPWTDVKDLQVSFKAKSNTERIVYTLPILTQVLRHCGTSLTKLQLGSILYFPEYGFNKSTVSLIRKLCPNLKSLDIRHVLLTQKTAEFITTNFSDLTSIALARRWRSGCGPALSKLFSQSKCLESVEIEVGCNNEEYFSTIPGDLVESLSFGQYCTPEKIAAVLSTCKKLRSLFLEVGYWYRDPATENELENVLLAILKKDILYELSINTESSWVSSKVFLLNSISCFTNLKKLNLSGNPLLCNDVLAVIGSSCKNLSHLSLTDSYKVTDTGFQCLFPLLNLKEIEIQSLRSITERFLTDMHISSLDTFTCYYCERINVNEAVKLLTLGSQKLRQIKFITYGDMNLNLSDVIEQASKYVEGRSRNHTLKLLFQDENLAETLHNSEKLKVETQNHDSGS